MTNMILQMEIHLFELPFTCQNLKLSKENIIFFPPVAVVCNSFGYYLHCTSHSPASSFFLH